MSALSTLTNVQNSLFVPDLGPFINRAPTYTISPQSRESIDRTSSLSDTEDTEETGEQEGQAEDETEGGNEETRLREETPSVASSRSETDPFDKITMDLIAPLFAVVPKDVNLDSWSKEDLLVLNDRVRHMLHSRRSSFRRAMRGFGKYVSTRKLAIH